MIWISMTLLALTVWAQGYWYRRKFNLQGKAVARLIMALQNMVAIAEEQQKVNETQHSVNQQIGSNLEILGIHTQLIKPSIGFEAAQFLAWYNNQKEDDK